jgi:hypothetical protein
MSQESSSTATSSNLEHQLADAMTAIQMLMQNVGALTQQVSSLTNSMGVMQAVQTAQSIPAPQTIPYPVSPQNLPLPPSPPSQPLPQPSPLALAQDHAQSGPAPIYIRQPAQHVKEPKIAAPVPFSGKREDTESFINSCCLYINGRASEFGSENAKIYWILSYMQTGSAKIWRDYIISLMYREQHNFRTMDQLLQEIDRKFGDTDKRTTQSLKIRMIQQGDKSADEHVQEFEKAALEAGYEGYPLVVEFKRSLNAGLRKRLTELRPMPVTIQEWYDEAITMDRQWRVAKTEEAFYGKVNGTVRKPPQYGQGQKEPQSGQGSSSQQGYQRQFFRNQAPPQHGQRQNTGQPQRDPNAMDVDRNQARRPPMKCFKCNGLGHMAKDCRRQLDVRGMTYDEMAEYFEAAAAAAKDREELAKKKDFPAATQ